MPDVLLFPDLPPFMNENVIEPFYEEYIPGSVVLCRELSNGKLIYFQIPRLDAQAFDQTKLDELKAEVHAWWAAREKLG